MKPSQAANKSVIHEVSSPSYSRAGGVRQFIPGTRLPPSAPIVKSKAIGLNPHIGPLNVIPASPLGIRTGGLQETPRTITPGTYGPNNNRSQHVPFPTNYSYSVDIPH
jgi:hypothetical protein